jgi:hypothetical protein
VLQNEALKLSKQKAAEYLKTIQETFAPLKRPDFAKTAKGLGLEIYQTPLFARGEYLPKIGIVRDFQDKAFALTPEKSLSDLVETPKGYCILHLDSRVPASKDDFQKDKAALSQQLLLEKKNAVFNEFITRLRLNAKLEDHVSKNMDRRARQN